MKKAFPILGVLTAVLLIYALYMALVWAPTEKTMGNVQRIFYYHVPSAGRRSSSSSSISELRSSI